MLCLKLSHKDLFLYKMHFQWTKELLEASGH